MTTLQTRLAQADKPTRELLLEVWGSCPVCNGDCGSANPPVIFCPTSRFLQLLDAEAWENAALMLVPEGWTDFVRIFIKPEATAVFMGSVEACAATPALALAIACLKARGL